MDKRPIGIFDSGVGGLTVCKSIKDLLPSENIIYFGDTQRFPYGTRADETIIQYSREITDYLKSRDVKMIVVACNTASAVALSALKKDNLIPITGVIEAGARAACERVKGGKVGIIATRATVNSGSYINAIKRISPGIEIYQQHASVFVSLTEEGWVDDDITKLTARKYIQEIYEAGVRTIILGCTHFPLLKKAINDVYPDIELIDTGEEVAIEVMGILKEKRLENEGRNGQITFYASDITDTLQRLKGMFFGEDDVKISKLVIDSRQ